MKNLPKPFVEIIIVSYNGMQDIPRCIYSLKKLKYPHNRYTITIVDNHSYDETIKYLQDNHPEIVCIPNSANCGFGRANNRAMQRVSSQIKYIALLNQDSCVGANWLTELVETMEKNPQAGACGAGEKDIFLYEKKIIEEPKIKECVWMGCGSTILRKKALDHIGLFDPFYFMYSEDIDLTWRLKIAGWKILQNYNAFWFHSGKQRILTYANKRIYWAWKNRIYLILKFGSWKQIQNSLKYYLHLVAKNNRISSEKKEYPSKKEKNASLSLDKHIFLIKLFFSLFYSVPLGIISRFQLRRKFKLNSIEVDSWIQYTDSVFYGKP